MVESRKKFLCYKLLPFGRIKFILNYNHTGQSIMPGYRIFAIGFGAGPGHCLITCEPKSYSRYRTEIGQKSN